MRTRSPAPEQAVLDYRGSTPVASRFCAARGIVPFAAAYALASMTVEGFAVFVLGQWNSYIGSEISMTIDSVACVGAAALASAIVLLFAELLRRKSRRQFDWRRALVGVAAGALCAAATFAPAMIDARLTGVRHVGSGEIVSSGRGVGLGFFALVASPLLLSPLLVRPVGMASREYRH